MNIGECEYILKNAFNISNDDALYILQIMSEEKGMKIPKLEYAVYYPFQKNNLTRLNLDLCEGTKIEISIAVEINDTIDKYNPDSGYYNDICYSTTSESNTDISLTDRREEFIQNNMSLCEENCDLIDYNYTKKKVKCSCDTKLNISEEFKFDKKEYLKSFIGVRNIMNVNILTCYKTVLRLKSLIYNYGFIILFSIILLYFITLFIFCFISFKKLKRDISNIIYGLKSVEQLEEHKPVKILTKAPTTKPTKKPRENVLTLNENKKKRKRKKNKNVKVINLPDKISELKNLPEKNLQDINPPEQIKQKINDDAIKKNKTIELKGIADK